MISVLVVDDSVVVRRLVTESLADDPGIRVVGSAPNGRIALAKVAQLRPDLVILDFEMPIMDGLQTLRMLRAEYPGLPVVMFSTLTASGGIATLDALAAGARDYVTKPANLRGLAESIQHVREQLIPRIYALCRAGTAAGGGPTRSGDPLRGSRPGRLEVVAIGSSTGGPDALARIIRALPASLPVPIVVVQHMPPVFTRMFAERLDRAAEVRVVEATSDQPLLAGTVYIAPGDRHLEVSRRGADVVTRLHSGPPENYCRPSVDVLFRSVAEAYGAATLAVILTGMGQDGRRGCERLRACGAEVAVQDQASSVVWGMPGAVVSAGIADAVLPLDRIACHLLTRVAAGRSVRSMEVTR